MNRTFIPLLIACCVAHFSGNAQISDKSGWYIAMQVPGIVAGTYTDPKTKAPTFGARSLYWGIPVTYRLNNILFEGAGAYAEGAQLHSMAGYAISISETADVELLAGASYMLTFSDEQDLIPTGAIVAPSATIRIQVGRFYLQSTYNAFRHDPTLQLCIGLRGFMFSTE